MSNEYKLVPVEPTPEMRKAAHETYKQWGMTQYRDAYEVWTVMLNAAPQTPALGGEAGAIIGSLERFESDGEDFVKLHDVRDVMQVVIAPLQAEITGSKKERSFFVARNDELHTRNAELEGLLLLIRDQPSLNPVHRARIKSALSKPAGREQPQVKCPECMGTGGIERLETCENCKGSGKVKS